MDIKGTIKRLMKNRDKVILDMPVLMPNPPASAATMVSYTTYGASVSTFIDPIQYPWAEQEAKARKPRPRPDPSDYERPPTPSMFEKEAKPETKKTKDLSKYKDSKREIIF